MTEWDPSEATPHADGRPDTAIVPYVEALNDQGVRTLQSCSGHQHGDGTKSEGVLWLGPDALDEQAARDLASKAWVTTVCRRYGREDCWEVGFVGLARSIVALRLAMEAVFGVLDVEPPEEHHGEWGAP